MSSVACRQTSEVSERAKKNGSQVHSCISQAQLVVRGQLDQSLEQSLVTYAFGFVKIWKSHVYESEVKAVNKNL